MRWPLEKCASLANADPVTRELLNSTVTQTTHLHIGWQCLDLREQQQRHQPTQLGKGWSPQDPPRPRIGKG
eukprot:1612990-Pleurochrysis_carterae.AAC.2